MKTNVRLQINEELKLITLEVLKGDTWYELILPYTEEYIKFAKLVNEK